jgi:hypothetical protein
MESPQTHEGCKGLPPTKKRTPFDLRLELLQKSSAIIAKTKHALQKQRADAE